MNKKELKKQEAKKTLLEYYINPQEPLLIVIKSTTQSGMTRRMRVFTSQNQLDVSCLIADLCDLSINDVGLKIQGCGMDMTFWLANAITENLYRNEGEDYQAYQKKIKKLNFSGNGGNCIAWKVL